MPGVKKKIGDRIVDVLRDTGCSGIVVKQRVRLGRPGHRCDENHSHGPRKHPTGLVFKVTFPGTTTRVKFARRRCKRSRGSGGEEQLPACL